MHEESLFAFALEKSAGTERQEYLDAVCRGDLGLRRRVERLLAAHDRSIGILDGPVGSASSPAVTAVDISEGTPRESCGIIIASRFKLLDKIGEGGMGTVWIAEQSKPLRRKVALKLIKPDLDSKAVLARFDAERQALALMDHPNIAKVLDGGTTEGGRPYFVMELVKGVPITQYCDDGRLDIAERLELFTQVCRAIQHAHTKGIIHRDLKPSNILIGQYDGKPVPKVIDFGLAKAIHQPLTDHTLHTVRGVLMGTPLYLSPEQADVSNLDVDTRTDIYALGVILYELLTGTTPLERHRFKEVAWHEVLRLIREEDPPRPSVRLSSHGALSSLAAQRQLEPVRLTRAIRGELDWIVMKCLEKDRSRRYETAIALARDVERHLADESVEACPPSAAYRIGKFVRRNRAAVFAGIVMVQLLICGIMGTTRGLVRANRARSAESQRADGERKANAEAQRRLRQLEESNEILASIFQDLDPRAEEKEGRPLRAILGDRLTHAGEHIADSQIGDALLVAHLQNRLGISLRNLGLPRRAIPLLAKASAARVAGLGPGHRETLETATNLAEAYRADGQLEPALRLLNETLLHARAKLGPDDSQALTCMNSIAGSYYQIGKSREAIALLEEVLEQRKARLSADDPATLVTMNNLAECLRANGNLDKSLPLSEETLRLRRARLGPDHNDTLTSMNNLAEGYREAGQVDKALPLIEETVTRLKAKLGPDHPSTLTAMSNLAITYRAANKPAQASEILAQVLPMMRVKLSPDHPNLLNCMTNLAVGYHGAGRLDEAIALFEEILKIRRSKLGDDDPATMQSLSNLASCYQASGRLDEAIPLLENVLKWRKAKLAPHHPDTIIGLNNLATAYRAKHAIERASSHFEEAMTGMENLAFNHQGAAQILSNGVSTLEDMKRFEDAERWRQKWLAVVQKREGEHSLAYAGELKCLGANLVHQEKWERAEATLREALGLFDKTAPTSLTGVYPRILLGLAILAQKRYPDAEPLLAQGLDAIKARKGELAPTELSRLSDIAKQIAERYDTAGLAEHAAEWRKTIADLEAGKKPTP
jgi:eukaryotic-like serine/threonine-protein kinase